MHHVEVDVQRLGGGFGGKEDQANAWAAICAVGTQLTKRPGKICPSPDGRHADDGQAAPILSRLQDRAGRGSKDRRIRGRVLSERRCRADLSPPVLERTLFHCTNSYFVPNVTATAYSCRTNLPPNTAFRGFGGPQGMFVIECAIAHAAEKLGVHASEIQRKNLIDDGDEFPYGQKAESDAITSWAQGDAAYDFAKLQKEADEFNASSKYFRKGVATMPVCFGISFTKTPMNQARSLVHVYTDGTVAVSTGAVEMGQGVNTKIAQVAAKMFG